MTTPAEPLTSRIVRAFLQGNLSVLLVVVSLVAGAVALLATPREEDPQIVVPLADVLVSVPGASAREVERQVASRLEKLLYEVDGVEYVYSASRPGGCVVTVRFYVGEDREESLLEVHDKIATNADRVPPQVAGWVVKPVAIDDVPILTVTLWSEVHGDDVLRRVAEEVETRLQAVADTGRSAVIGGRPRKLLVHVDPQAAAAHGVGWDGLQRALAAADVRLAAGGLDEAGRGVAVEAGRRLLTVAEVDDLVVGVADGAPIYLRDVARVTLGPDEATGYVRLGFGPRAGEDVPAELRDAERDFAAVTVAVAKRRGTNAVTVADALVERMETIERDVLPDGVRWRVTRDYGETANHKVNELIEALAVAILIVVALIALILGWREGLIVATSVPITFSLTLLVNWLAGYTINRVTLFALILALGLVVDDPIVDVENIYRHLRMRKKGRGPMRAVLEAVNEVRPPIILATLAVIVSFVPMFFITGMMGPYMRPMALNVPLAMLMSLLVAFTITPWMSYHVLKGAAASGEGEATGEGAAEPESALHRVYGRLMRPLLASRGLRWVVLGVTALLFVVSGWLAADRRVPLKMLPFDNKNELQVVVDMPEGTVLERTEAVAAELAHELRRVPEVVDVTSYAGLSSAIDFNGLVRHYYLREGPSVADLRVNLVPKKAREHSCHELGLRVRRRLQAIGDRHGARIKIVEQPPGPPVLSTVVAEVYGRPFTDHARLLEAARVVERRLALEPAVVDVDSTVEDEQERWTYVPDREKARLGGVSEAQIAWVVAAAVGGARVAVLHDEDDAYPTPIELRLPRDARTRLSDLEALSLVGPGGQALRLSEIGRWERGRVDQTIYHKNLRPVVFVTAEMAGRAPAEAVLDVQADRAEGGAPAPDGVALATPAGWVAAAEPRPLADRSYASNGGGVAWSVAPDVEVDWRGEGEWKITLDVFRDLGLAFGAACLGIYVLLVWETRSYLLPLILMISIPLTVIGILPGFFLLQALGGGAVDGWQNPIFFTATAMIGMIALSGIAVRNAILLIEFVRHALEGGKPLADALIESGAVRIRPIFLTAATAMLAAWPITLDPIFSGLAWALIFGLLVSTAFTLVIIPVVYYMAYARSGPPGIGAASDPDAEA